MQFKERQSIAEVYAVHHFKAFFDSLPLSPPPPPSQISPSSHLFSFFFSGCGRGKALRSCASTTIWAHDPTGISCLWNTFSALVIRRGDNVAQMSFSAANRGQHCTTAWWFYPNCSSHSTGIKCVDWNVDYTRFYIMAKPETFSALRHWQGSLLLFIRDDSYVRKGWQLPVDIPITLIIHPVFLFTDPKSQWNTKPYLSKLDDSAVLNYLIGLLIQPAHRILLGLSGVWTWESWPSSVTQERNQIASRALKMEHFDASLWPSLLAEKNKF